MKKWFQISLALVFFVLLILFAVGLAGFVGYAEENVKPIKTELLKRTVAKTSARMFATGKVLKLIDGELKLERIVKKNGAAFKEVMRFQLHNDTNATVGDYVCVDYVNNGKNNIALNIKYLHQEAK